MFKQLIKIWQKYFTNQAEINSLLTMEARNLIRIHFNNNDVENINNLFYIMDVKAVYSKKTKTLVVDIISHKPGALIGVRGQTLDRLQRHLTKNFGSNYNAYGRQIKQLNIKQIKIHLEESTLWIIKWNNVKHNIIKTNR